MVSIKLPPEQPHEYEIENKQIGFSLLVPNSYKKIFQRKWVHYCIYAREVLSLILSYNKETKTGIISEMAEVVQCFPAAKLLPI